MGDISRFLREGRWLGKVGQRLVDLPVAVEHIYVISYAMGFSHLRELSKHPIFLVKMRTESRVSF